MAHLAHSDTMADLDALKALHAWMRTEDVRHAKCGDLELHLEPPKLAPIVLTEAESHANATAAALVREREALEDILMSGDEGAVESILRMNRRSA